MISRFLRTLICLITLLVVHGSSVGIDAQGACLDAANSQERMNFVFILMDDLGWGDLSATTGQFPTPNMDSLYLSGIQLQSHYVHLMCSPSRTQFLTGRYAMNLGFGEFHPWDDSEIGGIPIGQPTIANWLSEFGQYRTYGVGKWQVGYANTQLTPMAKGFEQFYGFYQGAINYVTKTYNDIEYGDIGVFDFFENERACYDVIDSPTDTMTLYSLKIREHLTLESNLQTEAASKGEIPIPFFMFASLQSMHVPLPVLSQFEAQCEDMVSKPGDASRGDIASVNQRRLYCQLTLKTDEVIGEIISALRTLGLYDNTLVVFTADNGAETDRGGSNYPFRGTKGELYEGNTHTLAAVTGGPIERRGLSGLRTELVSNLDWTPTLLSMAGYLDCIDEADRTWDGVDQSSMLFDDFEEGSTEKLGRDSLVLNVGDYELRSARIIIRHEGRLYKYVKSDADSAADRWIYSDRLSDVWTEPIFKDDLVIGLNVVEYDEDNADLLFSQVFEDRFLFDLTADEGEKFNLLNPELPHFDAMINDAVVQRSEHLLAEWMAANREEYFSAPIAPLHARLSAGAPEKINDGKFVRPFLNDKQYKFLIASILEDEPLPQPLRDLYSMPWRSPMEKISEREVGLILEVVEKSKAVMNDDALLLPLGLTIITVACILCLVAIYYCFRKRYGKQSITERLLFAGQSEQDSYSTFSK